MGKEVINSWRTDMLYDLLMASIITLAPVWIAVGASFLSDALGG